MLSRHELSAVITGLWGVFSQAPERLAAFPNTARGFLLSFNALLLALPIQILQMRSVLSHVDVSAGRYVTLHLLIYTISWLVWPVVMISLTRMLDRRAVYFRYVVAYNWLRGAEGLILFPMVVLAYVGIPPVVAAFMMLGVLGLLAAFLVYEWSLGRYILKLEKGSAAALVAGNILLRLLLADLAAILL